MIEIVFSESACGSLKMAQRFCIGEYQGGCAGGAPLGGNPADVYGFDLVLSVGDISENQLGNKRKHALEKFYSVYPNEIAQEIFKRISESFEAVRKHISAGESIRIWYSNQPDEMCGLFWFMWLLDHWKVDYGQVFIIKLPEWEVTKSGNIVRKNSFGDVSFEEWRQYLDLQKSASPVFIKGCASDWQTLKDENAPLRAVLNGQLVSVPENFYDDFILREIAIESETFQEVKIIGRVLGKYQLGIADAWIALRIDEMIQSGMLEVMSAAAEDMPHYRRVLKKRS
jgi:hypothetical protein